MSVINEKSNFTFEFQSVTKLFEEQGYRCFPAPFHRTGNFPFGGNHHRRYPAGMLERARIGVHVFPCRSGYVRREPFKTGKTRLCLYRC